MENAENLQFFFRQADPTKHQSVAAEGFNGIDAHAAHQLLDLMPPCSHWIHWALLSLIGIQPLHQLRTLGCDAPVAFTALTGTAQMAAHSKQCSRREFAPDLLASYTSILSDKNKKAKAFTDRVDFPYP